MNKYFIPLFFLVSSLLSGEQDLSLKFEKGQSHDYEVVIDLALTQSMPGASKMQYHVYAKFSLLQKIDKILENGNAEVEASIKNPDLIVSLHCPMLGNSFNFSYDSTEQKVAKGEALVFQELKEVLSHATYRLGITPNGNITNISGLSPLQKEIEKKVLSGNPMIAKGIMAILSESFMQMLHAPLFDHIPKSGATNEDSWTKNEHLPLIQTFTLKEGQTPTIEEKFTLDFNQQEETMMGLNLKGALTGTLTLDPKNNWPIENKAEGTFSGKQILSTPLLDQPVEIPLKLTIKANYTNGH